LVLGLAFVPGPSYLAGAKVRKAGRTFSRGGSMSGIIEKLTPDEQRLAELGYKQELPSDI
jgi:hypothetical protein